MLRSADKALFNRSRVARVFKGPRVSRVVQGGAATSTSTTPVVTGGASANTKGSWIEYEDSTTIDADGFFVNFVGIGSRVAFLVDIGIGAISSESVLVPDLMIQAGVGGIHGSEIYIPIGIPAGTRVSIRAQSPGGANTFQSQIIFVASEMARAMKCSRATMYGTTSTSISDCSPDPNNTANTKGAYDEIVASTTNPIKSWLLFIRALGTDIATSQYHLWDIATGAGGSESIILGDVHCHLSNSQDMFYPAVRGPFWYPIPAGTRLSARCQSSAASQAPVSYVAILGFD